MGPHRDFKLPPYALFKHRLPNGEEKWQIEPSLLPEGCVPYLVFVNKKAGGQQGKLVLKSMLSLFNPHQVRCSHLMFLLFNSYYLLFILKIDLLISLMWRLGAGL